MKYHLQYLITILVSLNACGGQVIEPLNPQDTTLPIETRRWIAAAEDGIIVARARRDAMREKLERIQIKQEYLEDEVDWGSNNSRLNQIMEELMDNQVGLAQSRLAYAEVELRLAESKYLLANAERAILHDLARYELEPLKRQLEDIRKELNRSRSEMRQQRNILEKKTTQFWQEYSRNVNNGHDTRPFWIGKASQINISTKEKQKKKTSKADISRSSVDEAKIPQNPF